MIQQENFLKIFLLSFFLCVFSGFSGCDQNFLEDTSEKANWEFLNVTASAYNSLSSQGKGNPKITAWGDTLKKGMKVIAVSPDLLKKGLSYNTPVRIDGLEGIYFVKDKMHSRWKNKVDIYMGENIKKARNFGRKKVKIFYKSKQDSTQLKTL